MSNCCCPTSTTPCCPGQGEDLPSLRLPVERGDLPQSVEGEISTSVGPVPVVGSRLTWSDRLGIWKVRWGIGRMGYTVPPGLYALGEPGPGSEVLVTANYRMTFDLLRRAAAGLDLWILVLDTKGVNVWCAAGKGTFGTDELVRRIGSAGLSSVVSHRRVIVPQLGAVGVAAHLVKERTGFHVAYGPVDMVDIPAFLESGLKATPAMRVKRFPLAERAALAPMELVPSAKWVGIFTVLLAVTGGTLGPGAFLADAARQGTEAFLLLTLAVMAGAVVVPVLLPWLPGRAFSLKGAITGFAAALALYATGSLSDLRLAAWALMIMSISSFLGMNFTGSSTYTSLSGVKKEMGRAVPLQVGAGAIGLVLWTVSIFSGGGVA